MITDEDYELSSLELALITQKFVIMQEWIKDIPDIVKFKDFIKYSSCTTQCYKHLLRVVVNSKSKILVKNDGKALSILRNVIKNNPNMAFDEETNKLSFQVFQRYVLHNNDDMNRCVNRLLLNVILDDESIKWLIDNVDESEHILNRILRYPIYNERIAKWAKQQYQNGALSERTSELIGLMIKGGFPRFITSNDSEKIWGIYYSKASDEVKKQLLLSTYSMEVLHDFISICKRLKYFDVIDEILGTRINK